MKTKFLKVILFLFLIIQFSFPSESVAVYMDLTASQISAAINVGNAYVQMDNYEFLSEWIVSLPKNRGEALLNTEYISLAYEAKKAASNGMELSEFDIEDVLSRTRNRLVFSVTLYGRGRNFAKDNEAVLIIHRNGEEEEIISTFWENGEGERVSGSTYEAECSYWFPAKGINPDDDVTLFLTSAVDEVWEFHFNLASLK